MLYMQEAADVQRVCWLLL